MDAFTLFLDAVSEGKISERTAIEILMGYLDDDTMEQVVETEGLR